MVILLVFGFFLSQITPDPLAVLEARARQVHALNAGYVKINTNTKYWETKNLKWVIESVLNTDVEFGPTGDPNVYGFFFHGAITVEEQLSWDARLLILGHEAGHRLEPASLTGTDSEVFADAVSFLVAREYGLDALEDSSRHLASYKQSLHILKDNRKEILWAAALLTAK